MCVAAILPWSNFVKSVLSSTFTWVEHRSLGLCMHCLYLLSSLANEWQEALLCLHWSQNHCVVNEIQILLPPPPKVLELQVQTTMSSCGNYTCYLHIIIINILLYYLFIYIYIPVSIEYMLDWIKDSPLSISQDLGLQVWATMPNCFWKL